MVPLGEHRSWHHELNSPRAQLSHLCNGNNYTLFLRVPKSALRAWYHPWHIWGNFWYYFPPCQHGCSSSKNRLMLSLLLTPSLIFCGHFYLPQPLKIKEVLFERKMAKHCSHNSRETSFLKTKAKWGVLFLPRLKHKCPQCDAPSTSGVAKWLSWWISGNKNKATLSLDLRRWNLTVSSSFKGSYFCPGVLPISLENIRAGEEFEVTPLPILSVTCHEIL